MTHRDEIVEWCNNELKLNEFKDFGPMGLQFVGKEEVKKIALAVSVSQEAIEKAGEAGADMLIVHHGLFWNNEPRQIDVRMQGRLDLLAEYDMSLLAYHLCLDAHPKMGNNVLALIKFDGELRQFGDIGWGIKLKRPIKRDWIRQSDDWNGIAYLDGPTQIRKIAAIVGGAAHYIHDAHREGYDLFITGEAAEPTQALAKELGINFYAGGHYNTEKSGVSMLGAHLVFNFDIRGEFIDVPNEV